MTLLKIIMINVPVATEFRTVINQFLENFDGGPKTIEDIIEFNNDHADEEFTARK